MPMGAWSNADWKWFEPFGAATTVTTGVGGRDGLTGLGGDDRRGEVAEAGVGPLGLRAQEVEGGVGGDLVDGHQDPLGLLDRGSAHHRLLQVRGVHVGDAARRGRPGHG